MTWWILDLYLTFYSYLKISRKLLLIKSEHLHHSVLCEEFHSGLTADLGTETELVKVTNDMIAASKSGLVSVALLDFSAAFYKVNLNIILEA